MSLGLNNCQVRKREIITYSNEDLQASQRFGIEQKNIKYLWERNTTINYYCNSFGEENKRRFKGALLQSINKWELSSLGITFQEVCEDESNVSFIYESHNNEDPQILSCVGFRPRIREDAACEIFEGAFINDSILNAVVSHQIGHMMGLTHILKCDYDSEMDNSIMNYTSDHITSEDVKRLAALYSPEPKYICYPSMTKSNPPQEKIKEKKKVFVELG